MPTEIQDAEYTEVAKQEDLRLILRDVMTSIEKELPEPGKEIPELYIESKIIIKLMTRGYKICKMEIK